MKSKSTIQVRMSNQVLTFIGRIEGLKKKNNQEWLEIENGHAILLEDVVAINNVSWS
jgi:hypothetical protein